MLKLFRNLFTALALWVIGCAQVFGLQQGYVCTHQDWVEVTASEHCHRDDANFRPCFSDCDSQTDGGTENDRKPHAPADLDLNGTTPPVSGVSIPTFIAATFALLPPGLYLEPALMLTTLPTNKPALDKGGESPPASVQVARCMVILV